VKPRVLVVEDDPQSLELMRYLLDAYGCKVFTAADGATAVATARSEQPDLVLCDLLMPEVDGHEVLRRLRADPALARTRVVAVTALATAASRDDPVGAGFDGILRKPIAPESFARDALAHLPGRAIDVEGKCILVVDDQAANREFLVALLGYKGHRLLEAADGVEALELVRTRRPHLVICDILMPTMDGYEFVRQLRADAAIADTAVIYCTAHYHEREARSLARACGVSHVITKPCEPALVLQIVEQVLRGQPPRPDVLPERIQSEHLRLITDKLSQKTAELQAAHDRLNALVDLNLELASQRDVFRLLDQVCRGARKLIGARCGALGIQGKETGKTAHFVSSGVDPETAAAFGLPPLDRGAIGGLFTGERALRIADAGGDTAKIGLPPGFPLSASLLAAPIVSPTLVYGWICLADKLGGAEFTAADERLLTLLAAQAGRLYENTMLYAKVEHHAAQLEFEMGERGPTESPARGGDSPYRELIEQSSDGIFITDADNNFVLVNSRGCDLLGYAREELLRMNGIETYIAEDRGVHAQRMHQVRAGEALRFERLVRRKDGSTFPAEVSVKMLPSRLVQVIFHDISQRKAREGKVARLGRIQAAIGGIGSAIVRIRDRDALLREACRVAVEQGGFRMAWIGMLDAQAGQVKPSAAAGYEQGFLGLASFPLIADEGNPRGVIGKAVHSCSAAVIEDFAAGPGADEAREHLERGYRSAVALPLIVRGTAVGTFCLYAQEPRAFEAEELRLLRELAKDIAFGLESGPQA
jgi:PAS domain S-box-containing protein